MDNLFKSNHFEVKTVLFDLDGTLLDTAPDLGYALNKLLACEGLPPVPLERIREVASDGSRSLLGLAFELDHQQVRYNQLRDMFLHFYHQHLATYTRLFPGMEGVLTHLENQGIGWGVVTNKPSLLAQKLLTHLDLARRCACIIGGNCTPRTKPFPDPLLLACERTRSLPRECVYIGDAERDIAAAKHAGMRSIAALYGYLPADASPAHWQADHYVDQPNDILLWLEQQLSCNLPEPKDT